MKVPQSRSMILKKLERPLINSTKFYEIIKKVIYAYAAALQCLSFSCKFQESAHLACDTPPPAEAISIALILPNQLHYS